MGIPYWGGFVEGLGGRDQVEEDKLVVGLKRVFFPESTPVVHTTLIEISMTPLFLQVYSLKTVNWSWE